MNLVTSLEKEFPGLKNSNWKISSPDDVIYNCVSHALNVNDVWWWPDPWDIGYWPDKERGDPSPDRFVSVFKGMGFSECDESFYEEEIEKIVLYCKGNMVNHAARQMSNGLWTSKLGKDVDIEHELLSLEGKVYGKATIFLKRSLK